MLVEQGGAGGVWVWGWVRCPNDRWASYARTLLHWSINQSSNQSIHQQSIYGPNRKNRPPFLYFSIYRPNTTSTTPPVPLIFLQLLELGAHLGALIVAHVHLAFGVALEVQLEDVDALLPTRVVARLWIFHENLQMADERRTWYTFVCLCATQWCENTSGWAAYTVSISQNTVYGPLCLYATHYCDNTSGRMTNTTGEPKIQARLRDMLEV